MDNQELPQDVIFMADGSWTVSREQWEAMVESANNAFKALELLPHLPFRTSIVCRWKSWPLIKARQNRMARSKSREIIQSRYGK